MTAHSGMKEMASIDLPRIRWVNLALLLATTVVCLTLDLATKSMAFAAVAASGDERIEVVAKRLEWRACHNPYGIWSTGRDFFGPGTNYWLAIFCTVAVAAILLWGLFIARNSDRLSLIVVGAILGGAIGNLHDRIHYPGVRDFIQVYLWNGFPWPTFNLADSFIVCGVILLLLQSFVKPRIAPTPVATST